MRLLTKALEAKLKKNGERQRVAQHNNEDEFDFYPVVKFFGGSAATWLITEMDADGDTLFGLCDLGLGSPELGYVSLAELSKQRFKPFGLPLERDKWFTAEKAISEYAAEARMKGRVAA